MPVQFFAGDLFANDMGAGVFAHGCNCQGSMGAGIAKEFRQRYPETSSSCGISGGGLAGHNLELPDGLLANHSGA
jgi:hypothetical protein